LKIAYFRRQRQIPAKKNQESGEEFLGAFLALPERQKPGFPLQSFLRLCRKKGFPLQSLARPGAKGGPEKIQGNCPWQFPCVKPGGGNFACPGNRTRKRVCNNNASGQEALKNLWRIYRLMAEQNCRRCRYCHRKTG
jgi:hypothetical protein